MPLSSLPAHGAFALSLGLVQGLWAHGVRDVVLAPGSRSAPLALVLHRADEVDDLRLHVRVDERSAGFLALGLATGSRRPVAVVTTSGTAVGNLLPAVMEAHHTGRQLIVVSADRPDRLRGTGANQTTEQAGIFGGFAPCHDLAPDATPEQISGAAELACCRVGPTQINVQLDGDLMPADPDPATWWTTPDTTTRLLTESTSTPLLSPPKQCFDAERTGVPGRSVTNRPFDVAPTDPLDHDNPARAEEAGSTSPLDRDNPARAEKAGPTNPVDLDNPARAEKAGPTNPVDPDNPARAEKAGPTNPVDPDNPARAEKAESSDAAPPLPLGPRTVVVAGDDAGPAARLLAEAGNWPLFAEPTSGARTGPQAIRTYRLLLGTELRSQIERVVVVGHPTLSRPVTGLITDPSLDIIAVRDRSGVATDPGRMATIVDEVPVLASPATSSSGHSASPASASSAHSASAWFDRWRAADDALSTRIDEYLAQHPGSPLAIASVVADAVGPHATLVVGSSNAVRDLDVMATPWPRHEHRFVVGNRGLAGIDGTVSTAVGIALGRPGASRTIAFLGDLTLLHDTNGLLIGPHEPRPDLTLVVLNDDGGAIFAGLEQGAPPYAAAFERVFGTPHHTDLAALCRAHGIVHERVTEPERLAEALGSQPSGIRLIEVPVSRADRRAEADDLRALAISL